jgi:aldose 1-epimerase
MRNVWITLTLLAGLAVSGCTSKSEKQEEAVDTTANVSMPMQPQSFGTLPDGREVKSYALKNKNGVEMKVINYGGIITHLKTADRNGVSEDIVLGYDSLDGYLKETPYFGALIGRYGNRIANGKFSIDGKEYTLDKNNNGQHLHGGAKGFDKVFWEIEPYTSSEGEALKLTYLSKDGEEGYPGNLSVKVDYILTDANELKIIYEATTDKKTVVNLTQHTYFNLTGSKRDILDHELVIKSDKLVPVTKVLIPTGKLTDVKGTPFDFNEPTKVGSRINQKDPQLLAGGGYDHCWVLSSTDSIKLAATLYDSASGRFVEVLTTEPAIQFYSGNFLNGKITGKNGVAYTHRFGLCLETEHFPDSPNQPKFPSVLLAPGEVYKTQTTYKFSTK